MAFPRTLYALALLGTALVVSCQQKQPRVVADAGRRMAVPTRE
jgi:hypothetical protein